MINSGTQNTNGQKPVKQPSNSTLMWNVLAMAIIFIAICIGLWFSLSVYTRHGKSIDVPNVKGMLLNDATYALNKAELVTVVTDSSYNRDLPAGTILEQSPVAGNSVKPGREIFLTVNAQQSPTLAIPDIADNCSRREAEAKLKALGFKLGPIEYVPGDPDWVIAVKCRGRYVYYGDRVSIDAPVVLVVGNSSSMDNEYGDDWGDEDSLNGNGDDDFQDSETEIEL